MSTDTAKSFQAQLQIGLLDSVVLRGQILSPTLAFGFTVTTLLVLQTDVPSMVPVTVGALGVLEFALLRFALGCQASARALPAWMGLLVACLEVSAVSLLSFALMFHFEQPLMALLAPTTMAYALFIVFTVLYLNWMISVIAGLLAAAQYAALSTYALLSLSPSGPGLEALFETPAPYAMRAVILAFIGIAAGMISFELSRRFRDSSDGAAEQVAVAGAQIRCLPAFGVVRL